MKRGDNNDNDENDYNDYDDDRRGGAVAETV